MFTITVEELKKNSGVFVENTEENLSKLLELEFSICYNKGDDLIFINEIQEIESINGSYITWGLVEREEE